MTDNVRLKLLRRIRFASALIIAISISLFAWNVGTAKNGRYSNGVGVGADYLAFYNAGDILNRFGPTRLYDQSLQYDLYHQRLSGEPPDAALPFANAPQSAVLFQPFARIDYVLSLIAWTFCAAGLYVTGVLAFCAAAGLPKNLYGTVVVLACAFEPFAIENIHGGQISSLAFALLGLGCLFITRGRRTTGGFLIGCCCYKPTLLLVILPALLLTRRWRELAGCLGAVFACTGASVLLLGVQSSLDYVRLLTHYAADAGASSGVFRTWKFVDLNAFATLLGLPKGCAASLIGSGAAFFAHTLLVHTPRRNLTRDTDDDRMFLALILAWTPVLNLYVGIYDAVLVGGSVILIAGVLLGRSGKLPWGFIVIVAALGISPWFSGVFARQFGVQVFSLVMTAWCIFLVRLVQGGAVQESSGRLHHLPNFQSA